MDALAEHALTVTLAVSLGQIRTLVEHPASMTHAPIPVAEQEAAGIDPGGIRLSIGLEHPDDLIADLVAALQAVRPRRRRPALGGTIARVSVDASLVQQVIDQEPGAGDALVAACRGLVIGLARGRFGLDPEAAEEVLQATVLRLWQDDYKALRAWRRQGRFTTYLTVIVSRLCLARRRPRIETSAAVPEGSAEAVAEHRLADRERAAALRRVLATATPRDRLLIVLRYRDERAPAEIAALLGLKPATARKALHDARRRLRRRLALAAPELFGDDHRDHGDNGDDRPGGRRGPRDHPDHGEDGNAGADPRSHSSGDGR